METGVLCALAAAIDELDAAMAATRHSLVDDHCKNAIQEVKRAMRMVIDWGDEE